MRKNSKYIAVMAALMFYANAFSSVGYAAESSDDIDKQIEEQRIILDRLNEKKNREKNEHLSEQIDELRNQLDTLMYNRENVYDAESAIDSIAVQLSDLQIELENQQSIQQQLAEAIDRLGKLMEERKAEPSAASANSYYTGGSHLINPGPQGNVSYTQDAINSQGNSTTIFKYGPNQVYKIYCRTGYITDLCFKKGEKLRFVGGGDTSAWAVNSTTVDNTPHVYIKPVVPTSTTNIIVTTDKRSYQLIVNTSEWYNPMICWTYDGEEHVANLLHTDGNAKNLNDSYTSKSYEELNTNYKIKGKSEHKPSMVYDDGEKTIIKFKGAMSKRLPAIFVREKGKKSISIANYKTLEDCYVIDCLVDQAEVRFSDTDVVSIERKK